VEPDQWKQIAVPALVTEEQFAIVQQRLHRNKRLSPRNTRRPSLLQGILVCRECGYAYYRSSTRSPSGILREYYRCSGTDGHRRPEGQDSISHRSWQRRRDSTRLTETRAAAARRRLQVIGYEESSSASGTSGSATRPTARAGFPTGGPRRERRPQGRLPVAKRTPLVERMSVVARAGAAVLVAVKAQRGGHGRGAGAVELHIRRRWPSPARGRPPERLLAYRHRGVGVVGE
jgi:hypothetical protein